MLQLSKILKNSTFFAYFYGQTRIRKLILSFTSLQWRKRVSNNGWSWPLESLKLQLSKIPKNSTFFAYFYGHSRIWKLIFSFTSLQWRKRVSNNGWSWPLQSLNTGRAAILFYYYDSEILVGLKPLSPTCSYGPGLWCFQFAPNIIAKWSPLFFLSIGCVTNIDLHFDFNVGLKFSIWNVL